VFGLSLNTTERGLERVFGEFGEIKQITIVYDARVWKKKQRKPFIFLLQLCLCVDPQVSWFWLHHVQ